MSPPEYEPTQKSPLKKKIHLNINAKSSPNISPPEYKCIKDSLLKVYAHGLIFGRIQYIAIHSLIQHQV